MKLAVSKVTTQRERAGDHEWDDVMVRWPECRMLTMVEEEGPNECQTVKAQRHRDRDHEKQQERQLRQGQQQQQQQRKCQSEKWTKRDAD